MLTLRYLLALTGALIATSAAALAVFYSIQNVSPYVKSVAAAISAASSAKSKEPIAVSVYRVYYSPVGGRWVLTDRPIGAATPPLYALGLGLCGGITPLLNRTYAPSNNTVHLTRCSYVLPAVEGNVVTHYLPLCREGTDFSTEATELEVGSWRIRLVVVKC